jgi:hypothetical protein
MDKLTSSKLEGDDWMIDWYEVATRILEINADFYRRNAVPKMRIRPPRLKQTMPEMMVDSASVREIIDLMRDPPVTQSYDRGLVSVIVAVGGKPKQN